MVGTAKELLFFLTAERGWQKHLNKEMNIVDKFRGRLAKNLVSKEFMYELLEAFGCIMLRDEIILHPIWEDKNGGLYPNRQLLKMIAQDTLWYEPLGISRHVAKEYKHNMQNYTDDKIDSVLQRLGYKKRYDRIVIPSIWEYHMWLTNIDHSSKIDYYDSLGYLILESNESYGLGAYEAKRNFLENNLLNSEIEELPD